MSTANIPGLTAQRAAARRTASNVRGRATSIRKELEDLEKEENDVHVAAAAMLEDIANDKDPLLEEAEELTRILGARTATPVQQRPVVATAAPVQPVTTPAAPVVVPPVVQQTPVTPAPVPTVTQPVVVVAPAATPAQRSVFDPRHWTFVQWLCAIILALVALKIGLDTKDWLANRFDVHGKAAWFVQVIWTIAVTATGFFGGGWLGRAITDRYAARRAARQQNPPATAGQNP